MKKLILAISAIALFSLACNKAKVTVEQPTQTVQTSKHLRTTDDPDESYEFTRNIQIFSEDGTSHVNAVVSAHTQEVLNDCLTEMKFEYQPLTSSPNPSTESLEGRSVSELAPYNAQALKISLDDEDLGSYKIYAKANNPWGRTWKYEFDFDSKKDNVQIGWVPNMTPNDKVGFTVGYKMCGLCSKNILVNSFVDASYMVANYNKPSKRLYVILYTDFYNNYWVTFY